VAAATDIVAAADMGEIQRMRIADKQRESVKTTENPRRKPTGQQNENATKGKAHIFKCRCDDA
jgi:hypothetical protein